MQPNPQPPGATRPASGKFLHRQPRNRWQPIYKKRLQVFLSFFLQGALKMPTSRQAIPSGVEAQRAASSGRNTTNEQDRAVR